jgi:hypothetical protein
MKAEELQKLFNNPKMTKYAANPDTAHYCWLPLIGLYTGARINEICQLNPSEDIKQDSATGIHYFHFTDESEPVVSRLLLRYKAAQDKLNSAKAKEDGKAAADAQIELDALMLFKHDMAAFQRMYAFLSQNRYTDLGYRSDLRDILLGPAQLYEALRARGESRLS